MWDVLGLKDEAEHSQATVYDEFNENIVRYHDGRFEVKLPWVPNHPELKTNEGPACKRLHNVMRKLWNDPETKQAYDKIIEQQLEVGIIELAPQNPDESRVFYMPHKLVVRKQATTTRVRMVHDTSAKPSSEYVSLNECLYIGPSLQPLLYDVQLQMRINPIWMTTGDVKAGIPASKCINTRQRCSLVSLCFS